MARNFAGGTDRIAFQPANNHSGGTAAIAFRFRSTDTTANVQLCARASATSRSGWMIILNNNTTGKILIDVWSSSSEVAFVRSAASTYNDGAWHSVVANISGDGGGTISLWVDGNLTTTTLSGGIGTSGSPLTFGDSFDTFWASFNGDIADVGYWIATELTADEVASYTAGMSARLIRPNALETVYAPMVRDYQCKYGTPIAASGFSGTTVSAHPRVIGSLV
jgi:hypothetical protein